MDQILIVCILGVAAITSCIVIAVFYAYKDIQDTERRLKSQKDLMNRMGR